MAMATWQDADKIQGRAFFRPTNFKGGGPAGGSAASSDFSGPPARGGLAS